MNRQMTEKIKILEGTITALLCYQKNRGERYFSTAFTAEEGEIILAALRVYRKKIDEIR